METTIPTQIAIPPPPARPEDFGRRRSTGSPPVALESGHRGTAFRSVREKAWRSLSSRGVRKSLPEPPTIERPASTIPKTGARSSISKFFGPKDLEHERTPRRLSRVPTALSYTSSSSGIDWRSQTIEGHGSLEPDTGVRPKAPYLVVTPEYIVKLKNRTEAITLFPELASGVESNGVGSASDPSLIIPVSRVVSAFKAESTRPSFGIEVWWESNINSGGFSRAEFHFNLPKEREDILRLIHNVLVKHGAIGRDGPIHIPLEIDAHINRIALNQDQQYAHQNPEIFPVVLRRVPRGATSQGFEELPRKTQDGPSYYLAVSANFVLVVEISRRRHGSSEKPTSNYYKMGLAALDVFEGHWTGHEERFVIKFRVPWGSSFVVELASRYCRQVAMTLMKADSFLKPAWPQMWQYLATFRLDGFRAFGSTSAVKESSFLEYGGLKRTLDGYLTAFDCNPVDWQIDFQVEQAPEFRLLPQKDGKAYSPHQLVAVFRALRYNNFFRAVSFKDVDLSVLCDLKHDTGRHSVASVSRSGRTLPAELLLTVESASVLHQELHALAFCSETLEQINFTRALSARRGRGECDEAVPKLPFLAPIFDLMQAGLTRCSRLVLDGNALTLLDIDQLVKTLKAPETRLTALSLSNCKISSGAMQRLYPALSKHARTLTRLDISNNASSVVAQSLVGLLQDMSDVRQLNLGRSIMGSIQAPLIPPTALEQLAKLEELSLSSYKMNEATLQGLIDYLSSAPRHHMRHLALNGCGITGLGAARVFEAIGQAGGGDMFVSININPLEQNVDHLARAIMNNCGPGLLHMDMVEFREDRNYARLLEALAWSTKISMLSLVGTGPTGSCSRETVEIFKTFFAINRTVRRLDLSGYDGKLDEGQLGPHFGLALDWLCDNRTLTHLRIRNQNLNEHREKLGRVVQQNRTLRLLDCEENNFGLTTVRFLAEMMQENRTLLEFPVSAAERERIWRQQLRDLNISAKPESGNGTSSKQGALTTPQEVLREVLDQKLSLIENTTERNRGEAERASGQVIDYSAVDVMGPDWPSLELVDPAVAASRLVRSSAVPLDRRHRQPYHVALSEVEGKSQPASPTSEIATSPSWAGPSTPEEYDVPGLTGKAPESVSSPFEFE